MARYGNNLGRCISGVNYPYLLRSPAGNIVSKDGAGADLPLTLGGGPLEGFTATEDIDGGEVVVIEEGTTNVTPVQISAPSYAFSEIARVYHDTNLVGTDTHAESSGVSPYLINLTGDLYLLVYVKYTATVDRRAACRLATITRAGITLGPEVETDLYTGSSLRMAVEKFNTNKVLVIAEGNYTLVTIIGSVISTSASSAYIGQRYTDVLLQVAENKILHLRAGSTTSLPLEGKLVTYSATTDAITEYDFVNLSGATNVRGDTVNLAATLVSSGHVIVAASNRDSLYLTYFGVRITGLQLEGMAGEISGTLNGFNGISVYKTDENRIICAFCDSLNRLRTQVVTLDPNDLDLTLGSVSGYVSDGGNAYPMVALLDEEHAGVVTYRLNVGESVGDGSRVVDIANGVGVSFDTGSFNAVSRFSLYGERTFTSDRTNHRMYSLGAGVVAYAADNAIQVLRFEYTGIEISNIDGSLGVCAETVGASGAAKVWPLGDVANSFSGLSPGMDYYLDEDGTISLSPSVTSRYLGTAVSATKMLTVPMILAKIPPHRQGTDDVLALGTINEISAARIVAAVELLENCQESLDELLLHQQDGVVTAGACDMSTGRVFAISGASAVTVSFTNIPVGIHSWALLNITDANGNVTLPTAIAWPDGVPPTLSLVGLDKVLVAFDSSANMSGNFDLDVKATP